MLEHQRRLAPRSLQIYRANLSALLRLLGEGRLASLESAQLRRFVAQLHARGLAPRSNTRSRIECRSTTCM